jgi:hypothetical protein
MAQAALTLKTRCAYCSGLLPAGGPFTARGEFTAHPACHLWSRLSRRVFLRRDGSLQVHDHRIEPEEARLVMLAVMARNHHTIGIYFL